MQLRVEGFTCFKREQVIEFDGLDLFAIAGPTGAGKSSLLDAMVYALYGRVPRVGKRGYTEFISLGTNRMSVRFDFRLGDRLYRVTRTARRQGAPGAQLEELGDDGDTLHALADGVLNVDKAVQQAVGLDYDGFIQAVVLPQGEFAKFLKSTPGERTTLLRDLLRLGRYEDMRKSAQTRSATAAMEATHIEKRLVEDYGAATPAEVERLEAKVVHDKEELVRLRRLFASAEAEAQKARRLREHTAELETKRAARDQLSTKGKEIAESERRVEAARRAAGVAPLLDRVRAAEAQAKKATEEVGKADSSLRRAVDSEKKAHAASERAEKAVKKIPELDRRIQQLGEIIGLLEPQRRAEQTVRRLERDVDAAEQRLKELGAEQQQQRKALDRAARELATTQRDLDRVGYDSELHQRVEEVLENAHEAVSLRQSVEKLRNEAKELSAEAGAATQQAEAATKRAETSAKKSKTATRRAEEAEAKLRDVERAHAADHLRAQLRAGESCPVCEQPVGVVPKARRASAQLEEVRSAAEEARRLADDARRKQAELQAEARNLATTAATAEKKAQKAVQTANAKASEYAEATRQVIAWARKNRLELPEPVEGQILKLDRDLRGKRTKHDGAAETLKTATKSRDEAQRALDKLGTQVESMQGKLTDLAKRLGEAREQLGEYEKKIRATAGDDDPREIRDSLQAERSRLEEARDESMRDAQAASRKAAEATAFLSAAKGQHAKAQTDLEAARATTRDAVREAGFESEASARAALLDEKAIHQTEREIREHGQQLAALDTRIAELEKELAGRVVSQQDLAKKDKERDDLAQRVESTATEMRVTEEQLQQLKDRVSKARELNAQLNTHREVARVYGALADELQSNRFQQYLLEETFRELVAGASERLKKLSDRYALVLREGGDFYVVDHDNASEQRSADTLSGGETFLTSLALALELSAQVQRAAGALQLESIFIDEGFGTLDPDTLETVAAAIESLPVGGRMVGIVTHIGELTERLPARIAVNKGPDGPQVHVHR